MQPASSTSPLPSREVKTVELAERASHFPSWEPTFVGDQRGPFHPHHERPDSLSPPLDGTGISIRMHERTLHEVPSTLVHRMTDDFGRSRSGPDDTRRSKLCRYERDGEEVFVALDFDEVIALTASEE